MPRLTVGILTCNRKEAVLRAIQSAMGQQDVDAEIVVVDSASTDGTADAIRARFPNAKLIRLPRNLGCPGGRNHIYANSTGDYIVNVDDDGWLGEGALQRVIARFDADPRAGILALRQVFADEPDRGVTIGGGAEEVSNFFGGVSAFRREMLEKIGYYPEDFFLFAEEAYLAIRAMDAGYRILSTPEIVMWHPRVGASAGTQWDYYRFRNQLLVVTRLFPLGLLARYLPLRIGSCLVTALRRGSLLQGLRAVGHVLWTLPSTLVRHPRCSAAAVRKYFGLRGPRVGSAAQPVRPSSATRTTA